MKNILIILSFIAINAQAQQTKKVTVKNDNPKFKEVYYVLKSDKTVKHGSYKKFNYKNDIIKTGYYKSGEKDSLWTEYYGNGISKTSTGAYSNGNQIGVWSFYNHDGKLEQEYDYANNNIIYSNTDEANDKEFKVIKGDDTTIAILDIPPRYIGGKSTMYKFIGSEAKFPVNAKINGISGKVYISFIIDSAGKTSNYKISEPVHKLLDEEAFRVVKLIPSNWSPGVINGETVSVVHKVSVSFTLK